MAAMQSPGNEGAQDGLGGHEVRVGSPLKPLPLVPELLELTPRVIWFETPERALADPVRFLAYLMTYGTLDDIAVVKTFVGDDGFREALDLAPAGIFDERSWAYWQVMAGRYPPPPMPKRRLPD